MTLQNEEFYDCSHTGKARCTVPQLCLWHYCYYQKQLFVFFQGLKMSNYVYTTFMLIPGLIGCVVDKGCMKQPLSCNYEANMSYVQ